MMKGPTYKAEERRFLIGNLYANHNPFLLSISIIWHKYHNLLAAEIHEENPNLSDEDIFQATKRRIVGHLQKITLYDWLPHYVNLDQVQFLTSNDLSNSIPRYQGHNPSASPDLRLEFSMAMRAGIGAQQAKIDVHEYLSVICRSVDYLVHVRIALYRTLNGTKGYYSKEKRAGVRKWNKLQLGISIVCFCDGTKRNHQTS